MKFLFLICFTCFANAQAYDFSNCELILKSNIDNFGRVKYSLIASKYKTELNSEVILAGKNNPIDKPKNYTNRNDRFSYWINMYNFIVLNEVAQNYPVVSIQEIENVWDKKHTLGKQILSLNEIEHTILRKEFVDEPRFHFALICASYSCPKLQNYVYKGSKLIEQFTSISKEFYNNQLTFNLDKKRNELYVSKLFDWYNPDFNVSGLKKADYSSDDEFKKAIVLDYLIKRAPSEISQHILANYNAITFSFMEWHWKLNESVF